MRALGQQFDTKLAANTLSITATLNQKLSSVETQIAKVPSLIADFDKRLKEVSKVPSLIADSDKQLEVVKVRLTGAISEWSDHHVKQTDTFELNSELPECEAWSALRKLFHDLEDHVAELEERIENLDKDSDLEVMGSGSASLPLCANFRSGTCAASRNCPSLQIADPVRCNFNIEHIAEVFKRWGTALRACENVKEKFTL